LDIKACGTSPRAYFYLDDCLFTGRTALEDLGHMVPTMQSGTELWVFFLAVYARGWERFKTGLRAMLRNSGVQLHMKRARLYYDDPAEGICDVLWPMAFAGHPHADAYVLQRAASHPNVSLFRPPNMLIHETLFSSPEARDAVEKAFMKAGAYINSLSANPNPLMLHSGQSMSAESEGD
jgi:hypothetical protein